MTDRPIDPTDRTRPTANGASTKAVASTSTDRADRPTVNPTDAPTDRPQRPTVEPLTGKPTDTDRSVETQPTTDHQEPWALRIGLAGALWALSTVASLMTSVGQVGFARWAGITGPIVFGVPIILDLFDVVLLLLGYRQGRRKRSPYPLWALAGCVAGFGFYTNVVHAGDRAGLVFGAASAVTFISWLVKLRIELTEYLVSIKHIPPGRPKFGKLALVAPRVALHCWTIVVRRRVTDGDKAVECAETWIVIYDDTFSALRGLGTKRRAARRLAKRTAWRQVFVMTGGPQIVTPLTAEVQTVDVTMRPTATPTGDQSEPTETPAVEATDRPTANTTATDRTDTDRKIDRPNPTDQSGDRQPKPDRIKADRNRPTVKPTGDRPTPAAVANARLLRERYYPNGLPADFTYGQVRGDTGWSFDRTKPAVDAYRAGADLSDEEPERVLAGRTA